MAILGSVGGKLTVGGNAVLEGDTSQIAKAWVNFNGTGVVTIRASYNVSSITDLGTGNYNMNFATPFADINYSTIIGCKELDSTANTAVMPMLGANKTVATAYTATFVNIETRVINSTYFDAVIVTAAIFR